MTAKTVSGMLNLSTVILARKSVFVNTDIHQCFGDPEFIAVYKQIYCRSVLPMSFYGRQVGSFHLSRGKWPNNRVVFGNSRQKSGRRKIVHMSYYTFKSVFNTSRPCLHKPFITVVIRYSASGFLTIATG